MKSGRLLAAFAGVLVLGVGIGTVIGLYAQPRALAADTQDKPLIARPLLATPKAIDAEALETYQFLNWALDQVALMEDLLHQALAEYDAGTLTLGDLENDYYYAHLGLASEITSRMPKVHAISFGVWNMFLSGIEEAWDDAAMFARCAGVNAGAAGVTTYLQNGFSYLSQIRNSINKALTD